MSKKIFIKELKSYFSIFIFFIFIFAIFEDNMSFAASSATCADIEDFHRYEHCRPNRITRLSTDAEGNIPITCNDIELDYNPYNSEDYYYDAGNGSCLAWGLGISISYAAASLAGGSMCTKAGVPDPTQIAEKTTKSAKFVQALKKIKDSIDIVGKVLNNFSKGVQQGIKAGVKVLAKVGANVGLSFATDPVIMLQIEFGIDAIMIGVTLGMNVYTCAQSLGQAVNSCVAAGLCGAGLGIISAASQSLIWVTTAVIYQFPKDQINMIKVCGSDWYSYAYTATDMRNPEIEWYPQYGSFSNSYSYKVDKALSGEYKCDDYVTEGIPALREEAKACLAGGSSDYCTTFSNKCRPILPVILDGNDEGICRDWNITTYMGLKDSAKEKFSCKGITARNKNIKNRVYREKLYKGKEFKISVNYTEATNCTDPRLDEQKGYTGLEQRYYFRGKEPAQYACNRFNYKNKGCRLSDGTVITKAEAAADEDKDVACRMAFNDAMLCCQARMSRGICLYNSKGTKAGRSNNTMCMRTLGDEAFVDTCTLDTEYISNPEFAAYTSQTSSINICARNVNHCPYSYNVSGGTELEELYCNGDYKCTNCVAENGNADEEWEGIKFRNPDGTIKHEYKYVVPLCSDKEKIWKKNKNKYPTMAYGQTKNFCQFNAHCTEIGESEYDFVDMPENKYMPRVCSDFVGDSQNLPYPVKVADLSMANSIKAIFKNAGVNIGDGSLSSINSAIDNMSTIKLVEVYGHIAAEYIIISIITGLLGASTIGATAGLLIGISNGALYTAQDISIAVQSDGNAKATLKGIVSSIINKPLIEDVDFDLGEYRGFTAPIAQCIKETLNNMFHNKAGQSLCKSTTEKINSEGLCGNDTFGPPESIRRDQYYYVVGDDLPADSDIFYKIQSRLQLIIKLVAILAIIAIGLNFLIKGDIDIFKEDLKKPKALIVGGLKFAIVFYFAVGNAWKTQFYDWIDKGSQYLYYKAFDLSLVGYDNYKNKAYKTVCDINTKTTTCGDECTTLVYTGSSQEYHASEARTVKIETWGAKGGNSSDGSNLGGNGGYSYGYYNMTDNQTLYIYVGGAGTSSGVGGWNGGVGKHTMGPNDGAGGGASDVRTVSGAWNNAASLASRIIVAGGGGGGSESEGGTNIEYGGYGGGGNSNGGNGGAGGGQPGQGGGLNGCTQFGSSGAALGGGGYYGGGANVCAGAGTITDSCKPATDGRCGGGGGGSGYIGGVYNAGGSNGASTGNGQVKICSNVCRNYNSLLTNQVVENPDSIKPIPTGSTEKCFDVGSGHDTQICYTNCSEVLNYNENGDPVYDYSDTYDGCYFGDNVYPEGKRYLAIFDSLDCKLMNYFSYGPEVNLPGILHMLLISLFFSPLAIAIVILGVLMFVILLVIVIKILYTFLMSVIAINILVYVSPVIFPALLFEKYKGIFTKWLDNMIGFCLQFVIIIIFAGFMIGSLDLFAIGSAKFVNHDPTTGRLPITICGEATDSILCIFKVNTSKGVTPIIGERAARFFGLGPVVSVVDSISRDFAGTVMTLLKFCLVMYILLEFLKKIPGVAADMVGGAKLVAGDKNAMQIMSDVAGTANTVAEGAKSGLSKGARAMQKGAKGAKGALKEAFSKFGKGNGGADQTASRTPVAGPQASSPAAANAPGQGGQIAGVGLVRRGGQEGSGSNPSPSSPGGQGDSGGAQGNL